MGDTKRTLLAGVGGAPLRVPPAAWGSLRPGLSLGPAFPSVFPTSLSGNPAVCLLHGFGCRLVRDGGALGVASGSYTFGLPVVLRSARGGASAGFTSSEVVVSSGPLCSAAGDRNRVSSGAGMAGVVPAAAYQRISRMALYVRFAPVSRSLGSLLAVVTRSVLCKLNKSCPDAGNNSGGVVDVVCVGGKRNG